MKTKFIHSSLACLVLFSGCNITHTALANQPIIIAQSIWKQFSSPQGGFKILMPGTPQENKQIVNTKLGKLEVNIFTVERKQEETKYTVSYIDYPDQYIELLKRNNLLDKALENGKQTALQKSKGTLISEAKISLNNYSGREINYTKPGDKVVKHRIYLVNKRLYQIIVETTKKRQKFLNKSMTGFFNSFNLSNI